MSQSIQQLEFCGGGAGLVTAFQKKRKPPPLAPLQREDSARSKVRRSLKFAARGGLLETDATSGNVGFEKVFAFDGRANEAAEHGDLTDVVEGVGDGSLKKAFR